MKNREERIAAFKKIAEGAIAPAVIQKLEERGYFDAPSSKKFHSNYEGGLFDHSHMVALVLKDITNRLDIIWKRKESPVIIGLLHDLCKMDMYTKQEDGSYITNSEMLLTGHGDKSAILAAELMDLTDEEMFCIRYHMGPYEGEKMWNNYSNVLKRYPNLLAAHTADMYASQILNI